MQRVHFLACLTLGRLLRAGKYSTVRIVAHEDGIQVRKHRAFYAPLLIMLGDPLVRILDTGVRVLHARAWHEREQLIYGSLYGESVGIDDDGRLRLPCLPGETLATLLEDPGLGEPVRRRAIELAVAALAGFHRRGFTHGDAMAENVMIDLTAGVARWFDFETVHDERRPMTWRRADDLRALLATCLARTAPGDLAASLHDVLDVYGDEEATSLVAESFTSAFRRPLPFHLGQAAMSFEHFREIDRLLRERAGA